MAKPEKARVEIKLDDADGKPRDLWPEPPTLEEVVQLGVPQAYDFHKRLLALWPALTIEEKEFLGFRRDVRAAQIERLIADVTRVRGEAIT